jgi:hypothetical protein
MTSLSFADFQIQNLSIFLEVFPWYVIADHHLFHHRLLANAFPQKRTPTLLISLPYAGISSGGARGNMGLRMMQIRALATVIYFSAGGMYSCAAEKNV